MVLIWEQNSRINQLYYDNLLVNQGVSVEICEMSALLYLSRARTRGMHYYAWWLAVFQWMSTGLKSMTTDRHLCFQNLGGGQIPVSWGSCENVQGDYLLTRWISSRQGRNQAWLRMTAPSVLRQSGQCNLRKTVGVFLLFFPREQSHVAHEVFKLAMLQTMTLNFWSSRLFLWGCDYRREQACVVHVWGIEPRTVCAGRHNTNWAIPTGPTFSIYCWLLGSVGVGGVLCVALAILKLRDLPRSASTLNI